MSSPPPAVKTYGAPSPTTTALEIECPICMDEFDLASQAHTLRVLPCTDVVCHECLVGMLDVTRSSLRCPKCQKSHGVHHPALSTAKQLAGQYPTVVEWTKAVQRNSELLDHTQRQRTTRKEFCSEDGCASIASHFCIDQCGLQCAEHEASAHREWPTHQRTPLAKQQGAKLIALEAQATARKNGLVDRTSAMELELSSLTKAIAQHHKDAEAFQVQADAELAAILSLEQRVATWKKQHQDRTNKANPAGDARLKATQELQTAECKLKAFSQLSAASLLRLTAADIDRVLDPAPLRKLSVGLLAEQVLPLATTHVAIAILQQLNSHVLLPTQLAKSASQPGQTASARKPERRLRRDTAPGDALQGFLGPDKPITSAKLLYKASRDGWEVADFFRECAERGPSLTLIKAAGTGYIFGAYTAVSWPKPSSVMVNTPDPSGTSFMFSLTNKYGRPFRMSLKDRSRALRCGSRGGPCFGGEEKDAAGNTSKYCNLMLIHEGTPANEPDGNCSNGPEGSDQAYQLDRWDAAEPSGFKLDGNILAGSQCFAAAEIEVYSL